MANRDDAPGGSGVSAGRLAYGGPGAPRLYLDRCEGCGEYRADEHAQTVTHTDPDTGDPVPVPYPCGPITPCAVTPDEVRDYLHRLAGAQDSGESERVSDERLRQIAINHPSQGLAADSESAAMARELLDARHRLAGGARGQEQGGESGPEHARVKDAPVERWRLESFAQMEDGTERFDTEIVRSLAREVLVVREQPSESVPEVVRDMARRECQVDDEDGPCRIITDDPENLCVVCFCRRIVDGLDTPTQPAPVEAGPGETYCDDDDTIRCDDCGARRGNDHPHPPHAPDCKHADDVPVPDERPRWVGSLGEARREIERWHAQAIYWRDAFERASDGVDRVDEGGGPGRPGGGSNPSPRAAPVEAGERGQARPSRWAGSDYGDASDPPQEQPAEQGPVEDHGPPPRDDDPAWESARECGAPECDEVATHCLHHSEPTQGPGRDGGWSGDQPNPDCKHDTVELFVDADTGAAHWECSDCPQRLVFPQTAPRRDLWERCFVAALQGLVAARDDGYGPCGGAHAVVGDTVEHARKYADAAVAAAAEHLRGEGGGDRG